jgi:hypothetical protein
MAVPGADAAASNNAIIAMVFILFWRYAQIYKFVPKNGHFPEQLSGFTMFVPVKAGFSEQMRCCSYPRRREESPCFFRK